jgi:exonuclease III
MPLLQQIPTDTRVKGQPKVTCHTTACIKPQANRPTRAVKAMCDDTMLKIKGALINVRSLREKSSILNEFIVANKADIIAVTETWLTGVDILDSQILSDVCPPNFGHYNIPRLSKKEGGLALIFRNNLVVRHLTDFHTTTAFELSLFHVKSNSDRFMFGIIYRPPSMSLSIFEQELTSLVTKLLPFPKVILCGDFNLCNISPFPFPHVMTFFCLLLT